ncbi:uncharacterized protein LOC131940492 isoform X2 [Physella acuta]|uniref:uncharacterized protein LOC131940492 isoform X2 n=1 Tax=Physella acuta TaxID=109671 RepID=UPI0027DE367E|nr:uncharacterized protein LOC131940492 isoform X2 [Physella acuta]
MLFDLNTNENERNSESEMYLNSLNNHFMVIVLPAIVVLGILMLIGGVGNSLVLYVYTWKKNCGTITRFIQALAMFDLLSCCIAIPGEIIDMTNNYTFGRNIFCQSVRTLNLFCTVGSGCTLVVVAIDRFAGTFFPLIYNGFQMTLFIIGALILIILYSIIARRIIYQARRQQRRHSFNFGVYFGSGSNSMCSSPTENQVRNFNTALGHNHAEYSFYLKTKSLLINQSIHSFDLSNKRKVINGAADSFEPHPSKFIAKKIYRPTSEIDFKMNLSKTTSHIANKIVFGKQSFTFSTTHLDLDTSNFDQNIKRYLSLPVLWQYKCTSQSFLVTEREKQSDLNITNIVKKDNMLYSQVDENNKTSVLDQKNKISNKVKETSNEFKCSGFRNSSKKNQIEKREFKSKGDSVHFAKRKFGSLRGLQDFKNIPKVYDYQGIKKTTLMLFSITLVYILSFLPHLVLMTLKSLDLLDGADTRGDLVHNLLIRSYFINSVSNPVIYSFFSKSFFRECRYVLKCLNKK